MTRWGDLNDERTGLTRNLRIFLTIAALMLFAALPAAAQTRLGPVDDFTGPAADLTRLKIGEKAPDFTLEDQDGKPVTLSSYRNRRAVVLVFYRGYW